MNILTGKLAMTSAVESVDAQSDRQPTEEPQPGQDRQSAHQQNAKEDAQYRGSDSAGRTESAMAAGITIAEDDHAYRNQHEGKKRANIRKIGECTDIEDASWYSHYEASNPGCRGRRSKSRMDTAEKARQ